MEKTAEVKNTKDEAITIYYREGRKCWKFLGSKRNSILLKTLSADHVIGVFRPNLCLLATKP